MTALSHLHDTYANRHALPGQIGCITQAVPIELVLATGLTPKRIYGDPSQSPGPGARYMEDEVDGEVRSIFDQLVQSRYAGLPLILLPRSTEQLLQLHYYVGEIRKWEPQAQIPPVQIVDIMQTALWSTGRYVRARMDELAQQLGALGTPATEGTLQDAIAATNAMRAALQRLNTLRRDGRIKGSDMFRITALFGAMPPDDFLFLAAALEAEAGPPAQGPRLMLSGYPQDTPALYEAIEAQGAQVAADDHTAGERLYARLIDTSIDPMEAISEHYHLHVPGLRQYPQKPQDDRFIATCQAAQVQADLCVLEPGDDTLGWDWPGRRDRLASLGIPSHLLTKQDYFRPDTEARDAAIAALLEAAQ